VPNPFEYPEELRAEAVRLYKEEGLSLEKVATRVGVTRQSVSAWVKKTDAATEATASHDTAEIRRLQKELRRAQQERDILKKAVAFFARESEDR